MDEPQQELNRCQSLPVLNREETVLRKVQEQDGIISLMQTQIEFQSEVIAKHDQMFEDLIKKVQDLTSKIKTLEETLSKQSESADQDAARSALWTGSTGGGTENKISIADLAKETAEQTLGVESSYVYDETLGLYYDHSSGYYYDPVKQLFYNGHTQTYYSYDSTTNTYQEVPSNGEATKRKTKSKHKRPSTKKQQKVTKSRSSSPNTVEKSSKKERESSKKEDTSLPLKVKLDNDSDSKEGEGLLMDKSPSDMEEGEISSSLPTTAESTPVSVINDTESEGENEDQTSYPPCIRAVVQTGPSGTLKKGTLFLVPFTGGSIGSSKSSSILLPFSSIEKVHAKIEYQTLQPDPSSDDQSESSEQTPTGKYIITDLGSIDGTFLNRTRLSEAGVQSEPHELVHGSTVEVGGITLLIHIHPGDFTCGHCEPGLLIQKDPMYEYTGKTSENIRKSEMKKVKKKYGLDRNSAKKQPSPTSETKYTDRAQSRRLKVGSDNPFAKTEVASTETAIKKTNVGFKMLQKMGWKGEGLGAADKSGITEPIKCDLKADRGGLGFEGPAQPVATSQSSRESSQKSKKLAKTIERFNEASVGSDSPKESKKFDY